MHPIVIAFIDRQKYECVGTERYKTKKGAKLKLLVMQSNRLDCRQRFYVRATMEAIETRNLNRRCKKCKCPDKKVTASGQTRVASIGG